MKLTDYRRQQSKHRQPMDISQNFAKINVPLTQRRKIQVHKYLTCKPNDKCKTILRWTRTQVPDPWPEANVRKIHKIIRCLQNASKHNQVSWNTKRPEEISSLKWRLFRLQDILLIILKLKKVLYLHGSRITRGDISLVSGSSV